MFVSRPAIVFCLTAISFGANATTLVKQDKGYKLFHQELESPLSPVAEAGPQKKFFGYTLSEGENVHSYLDFLSGKENCYQGPVDWMRDNRTNSSTSPAGDYWDVYNQANPFETTSSGSPFPTIDKDILDFAVEAGPTGDQETPADVIVGRVVQTIYIGNLEVDKVRPTSQCDKEELQNYFVDQILYGHAFAVVGKVQFQSRGAIEAWQRATNEWPRDTVFSSSSKTPAATATKLLNQLGGRVSFYILQAGGDSDKMKAALVLPGCSTDKIAECRKLISAVLAEIGAEYPQNPSEALDGLIPIYASATLVPPFTPLWR